MSSSRDAWGAGRVGAVVGTNGATAPARERFTNPSPREALALMSKLLRGVAAGYGAKKLGGGCFSTVLVFIILWWLLGHFGIFK